MGVVRERVLWVLQWWQVAPLSVALLAAGVRNASRGSPMTSTRRIEGMPCPSYPIGDRAPFEDSE